jgi:Family of unknown function (DUF6152)
MKMRTTWRNALVWLLWLISAAPALAHHSFAMYDPKQILTLNGTVKEFQWSNPHAVLWMLVATGNDTEPALWTIELPTSPAGLVRMGWDKRALNSGDQLVLEINPLRDGEHGGSFRKATVVASGKVLTIASPLTPSVASTQSIAP